MNLRGEYWYSDGYLESADDDNHEAIADQAIYSRLIMHLPVNTPEYENFDPFVDMDNMVMEMFDEGYFDSIYGDMITSNREEFGDEWGREEFVAEVGWGRGYS